MSSKSENLKREMINLLIIKFGIDWHPLEPVSSADLITNESDIVMRKIIAKLKEKK